MEEQDVVRALAGLAQPLRLRVFRSLVVAGPKGLTPGALVEQLDVAAATLSFHLKELTGSRLVSQERDGRFLIYRACFDQMDALLGYLTNHCCEGQPCLDQTVTSCKPSNSTAKRVATSPRPRAMRSQSKTRPG